MSKEVEDILGENTAPIPKKAKAAASTKTAKASAKPAKAAAPTKAAPRAAKDTKGKSAAAKPAKAKAKSNGSADRVARGEGKFYFDATERQALANKIAKLKKPATTIELAAQLNVPTFKVRLAAVTACEAGSIKMKKEGNAMVLSPK